MNALSSCSGAKRFHVRLVVATALAVPLFAGCGGSANELPQTVEFNRHIRPILSDRCFTCHGPDPGTREADLRLDFRESATQKRDGYARAAIVPGSPSKSELIRRIKHSDPDERMPPQGTRARVEEREIALLERWIRQGAEWEPHWFYIPPARRDPPGTRSGGAYIRNDIDRFIVAHLERDGFTPSPEADRVTLIRRAYFDLIGLPPTIDEIDAFVDDDQPGAFERVVAHLLASPHFGERMAMFWLDLVRYADTDGFHSDLHRNVSPYRDYVIQAFNTNKRFDQFTREQLAGDLLPHATMEQLVAAGFNRIGQATKEGGSQSKEYLAIYAGDRVRTVATAWMGSTMGCAECHDHKFDPFTQADFYRMASFFADVKERGVYMNQNVLPPEIPLLTRSESTVLEAMDRRAEQLRRDGAGRSSVEAVLARKAEVLADVPYMLATASVAPRPVRVLRRGNWQDNKGTIVEPGVPEILPPLRVEGRRATRLDLADWLVSRENPTTARVLVNHLWARFFGRGIARVLDDLGSQGEWPTHLGLLDWLAVEFMESGWDVKHMVRLIVTSATYRQSSEASPELRSRDPENRYLARQSRFRLDGEIVRDNALAVSGLLSRKVGGPSVKPYQPEGYWSDIQTFGTRGPASEWNASEGDDQYRRGLYTYWKRSFLHPAMMAFDVPDRQECLAERTRSDTPLQALVLLNDPSFVEAARVFAERIMDISHDSPEAKVQWAFKTALSREPEPGEAEALQNLYEEERRWYAQHAEEAEKLVRIGQTRPADGRDVADLAAWTSVARAIFNVHEMVARS